MLLATDDFLCLLAEFLDLTQPTFSSSATKHGVECHIATTGPPTYAQAQRLNLAKLTITKAEFENMVRLSIIRHYAASPKALQRVALMS